MQVSRSLHSEVSEKGAVRATFESELGPVLQKLAMHHESEIVEGHLKVDHVHMMIPIPPKYSVSEVIGYIKGRVRSGLPGQAGGIGILSVSISWARGYYVSTVGLNEGAIREYVRSQEEADEKLDQLRMFE